ncbi:hypothetical protein FRC17_004983 [Serendipita sp. 399]|nr:hypothetical protein FRC17_004983 [Serendipita sp. 399]
MAQTFREADDAALNEPLLGHTRGPSVANGGPVTPKDGKASLASSIGNLSNTILGTGMLSFPLLFPIYNELKSNTQERMDIVIGASIGGACLIYEVVAVLGYLTFGSKVGANIMEMYPSTSLFIACGQLAIVILVLFSYPLQVHPCRNCLDKIVEAAFSTAKETPITHTNATPENEDGDYDHGAHDESSPLRHTLLTATIIICGFTIAYFVSSLQIALKRCCQPPASLAQTQGLKLDLRHILRFIACRPATILLLSINMEQSIIQQQQTAEEIFNRDRASILLKLASLSDDSSKTEASQLKERNNQLIDNYLRAVGTDSKRVDPSVWLPVELFLEIIMMSFEIPGYIRWEINRLLELTLVSIRWQEILMANRQLWSTIVFREDNSVEHEMKLLIALHLSGDAPLTLCMPHFLSNLARFRQTMGPHLRRINNLILNAKDDYHHFVLALGGGQPTQPPSALDELEFLPELRTLYCAHWPDLSSFTVPLTHFIQEHPKLDRVGGIWLTSEMLGIPSLLRAVTSFRSQLRLWVLVQYLKFMTRVQRAELTSHRNEHIDADKTDGTQYSNLSLQWISCTLPSTIPIQLLDANVGTLTKLRLKTTLPEAVALFEVLHRLQKLEDLDLTIICRENQTTITPLGHTETTSLRSVRLNFEDQMIPENWVSLFVPMMQTCFGNVETLSITAYGFDAVMPPELLNCSQFKNLKYLMISLSGYISSSPYSLQNPLHLCPQLKGVTLFNVDSIIKTLSSSTTTHLYISNHRLAGNSHISLNPGFWPALTTLCVPMTMLDWQAGSFKNLKTLNIESPGNGKWDRTTQFCRDLARYPDQMPVLESLTTTSTPEWDILFILLELYNFRPEIGSTRISTLSTGGYIPSFLLAPLTSLCNGKFVDRPSNLELCWIGNLDIICDFTISMTFGHPNSDYDHLTPARSITIDELPELHLDILFDMPLEGHTSNPIEFRMQRLPVPPYPQSVGEILETWEHRESAWQKLLQITDSYTYCSTKSMAPTTRIVEGKGE